MKSIKMKTLSLSVVLALLLIQVMNFDEANCAPNGMNGINNNNNFNRETAQSGTNKNTPNKPINFLRGLFRRQTSSSSTSSTSSDGGKQNAGAANNIESESDDVQNQTEMDAQKFMDSLPNVNNDDRDRPNTFRERVSGTFGVLRDGVSNQFKTIRENWSETLEDLRDTWSNSE